MFNIDRHVGRLVEVRTASPVSFAEIAHADQAMGEAERVIGRRIVVCADYRHLSILPAEQADQFVAMFRKHNASIEASAILVAATSATAVLQMERVISESKNPSRRCFRSAGEAADWLRTQLTQAEAARVDAFLSLEAPAPS